MDQDPLWSHETLLPAEPGSAAKARAFVLEHLVEHRLLYLVDDVRLVTSELAAHAALQEWTAFTVTLEGRAPSVLVTVRDASGTRTGAADVVPLAPAASGHGAFIVNMFSESSGMPGWDGNTTSMWASFKIRPRPDH